MIYRDQQILLRGCIMFVILVLICAAAAIKAHSHEHYSASKNPVSGENCCGGSDCAPANDAWISMESGGYHVILTTAQVAAVNPRSTLPVDTIVPYNDVLPSFDGRFHLCIYETARQSPRNGVICLFVPTST